MLQAHVHACGAGDPNLLVIAGHIATEETWDTFSQAWKSQLDSARFRRRLHLHGGRANGSKNEMSWVMPNLSCPKAGEKDDSGARPSSNNPVPDPLRQLIRKQIRPFLDEVILPFNLLFRQTSPTTLPGSRDRRVVGGHWLPHAGAGWRLRLRDRLERWGRVEGGRETPCAEQVDVGIAPGPNHFRLSTRNRISPSSLQTQACPAATSRRSERYRYARDLQRDGLDRHRQQAIHVRRVESGDPYGRYPLLTTFAR